jgi:hypothetical protein
MATTKEACMMENKVIIATKARETSRLAAERVYPKSGSIRLSVYEYLIRQGLRGATDQEMQSNLNLLGDTIRPTRMTLLKDGFIIDSGETRNNTNGNPCVVWRAIDTGMMF